MVTCYLLDPLSLSSGLAFLSCPGGVRTASAATAFLSGVGCVNMARIWWLSSSRRALCGTSMYQVCECSSASYLCRSLSGARASDRSCASSLESLMPRAENVSFSPLEKLEGRLLITRLGRLIILGLRTRTDQAGMSNSKYLIAGLSFGKIPLT